MILPEVWCNDFFTKILSNRRTGRKPKSRVILVNNAASTWDQWAGLLQSTFVYLTPVYIIIVTNGPNPPHYWSDTSPPADLNTDELKVVIVKYVMRSLTKMEGHHPPFQTPVRFLAGGLLFWQRLGGGFYFMVSLLILLFSSLESFRDRTSSCFVFTR